MADDSILTMLGIKNFQKENSAVVQALSVFEPINTATESLSSPATFNTRFKKLSDAIRHCFNAAGDIAIRDKRYLETFLTGYTNPVVTQSFKYADPASYKNLTSFNTNGVPITFTEDRISYNISNIGELNNTISYIWVFKNGILLNEDTYTVLNTAYGVRCFIKASIIAPNDEVSISVNRIFNTSKNVSTKAVTTTVNKITYLVPISELGTFYHNKYIRLFVKRGTDLKRSFIDIPRSKYTTEVDITGTTLKVDINDFTLNAGETVYITNAIYYWSKTINGQIRTNLSTYSNVFSNPVWTTTLATITENAYLMLDNKTYMTKLSPVNGANLNRDTSYISKVLPANLGNLMHSIYAKAAGCDRIKIRVLNTTNNSYMGAIFSLSDGKLYQSEISGFTGMTTNSEYQGDGIYRFNIFGIPNSTTGDLLLSVIPYSSSLTVGNGSNGIYISCHQVEVNTPTRYVESLATPTTASDFSSDIELTEKQTDGSYRPVPHLSVEDFDVFYNGYYLVPGKQFTIIKGGNEFSPYKIKLLFTPDPSQAYTVRVYKNEAVAEDKDFVLVRQDQISMFSVIKTQKATTLPLMPSLGHCFVANKYVPNKKLKAQARRILTIDDLTSNSILEYKVRVVSTLDIAQIMNFINNNLSEIDLMSTWIDAMSAQVGIDGIYGIVESTRTAMTLDTNNKTFANTFNSGSWTHNSLLTAAVEQFRVIADAYKADNLDRTLVIDSNTLTGDSYPLDIVDDMLVLDSNMSQTDSMVLDANVFFKN